MSSGSDDERINSQPTYEAGANPNGYFNLNGELRVDQLLNQGIPEKSASSSGSGRVLSGSCNTDPTDTGSTTASRIQDSSESDSEDPVESRTTDDSDIDDVFLGMSRDVGLNNYSSQPSSDLEAIGSEDSEPVASPTDDTCPQGICDNGHRFPEPTDGPRSVADCNLFRGLEVVGSRRDSNSAQRAKENREEFLVNNPLEPCDHIEAKYYGPEMGHGVRAKQHICKNSMITRYHGVDKDKAEVLKIEEAMEKNNSPPGDYIFHWKNVLYVDATTVDGSLGRLINHSRKNPNAAAKEYKIKTGPHAGERAIVIRAIKCIPPGAQIFYAYGETRPEILRLKPWLKL